MNGGYNTWQTSAAIFSPARTSLRRFVGGKVSPGSPRCLIGSALFSTVTLTGVLRTALMLNRPAVFLDWMSGGNPSSRKKNWKHRSLNFVWANV